METELLSKLQQWNIFQDKNIKIRKRMIGYDAVYEVYIEREFYLLKVLEYRFDCILFQYYILRFRQSTIQDRVIYEDLRERRSNINFADFAYVGSTIYRPIRSMVEYIHAICICGSEYQKTVKIDAHFSCICEQCYFDITESVRNMFYKYEIYLSADIASVIADYL